MNRALCCIVTLLLSFDGAAAQLQTASKTTLPPTAQIFNPLLPGGPDPWVIYKDGYYFYMNTTSTNLTIWKTPTLANLRRAEKKVVWTPPVSGPYSHDVWAPE